MSEEQKNNTLLLTKKAKFENQIFLYSEPKKTEDFPHSLWLPVYLSDIYNQKGVRADTLLKSKSRWDEPFCSID